MYTYLENLTESRVQYILKFLIPEYLKCIELIRDKINQLVKLNSWLWGDPNLETKFVTVNNCEITKILFGNLYCFIKLFKL